jgi:probable phosphoglycerate mutase
VRAIRVLLVRHGQSVWNAEGRWQGTLDPPLSELGERQASVAAGRIEPVPDTLWASPLHRAVRTAELIGAGVGLRGVTVLPGLQERHAGEFQGLTRAEIDARWPGWLELRRRPDGWEHDDVLVDRARSAIGAGIGHAAEAGHRCVVAVTHGGVLMALDADAGVAPHRYPNLSGRWYETDGAAMEPGERVELVPEGIDLGLE